MQQQYCNVQYNKNNAQYEKKVCKKHKQQNHLLAITIIRKKLSNGID